LNPVNFIDLIAGGLHLPPVVVGTWIAMGILIIYGLMARRALMEAPDPTIPETGITLRSVGEVIAEWLDGFVAEIEIQIAHWSPLSLYFPASAASRFAN